MLEWIIPREKKFFDFFEAHASIAIEAARQLLALVSTDSSEEAIIEHIQQLEHQADAITHSCVEALHKTFITPFERNDIHKLISHMDDIVDFIEATAARIGTYKVQQMTPEAVALATLLYQATQILGQLIKGLRSLKYVKAMRQAFIAINHLENQADTVIRDAIAKLFNEEKDPINIIKWKEIYENIEEAIDCCEDVSNIVEGVILECD